MNDLELRALVRDAVARHLGRSASLASPPAAASEPIGAPWQAHPSHAIHLTVVNVGDACVIEPSVPCTHCNYCKSHGH